MFVDQSENVVAKARANSSSQSGISKNSVQSQSAELLDGMHVMHTTQFDAKIPAMARSPKLNEERVLTDFFANNFTCGNLMERRTNLFWIPRNFDDFLKDESVRLSVQCTSAMAVARLRGSPEYAHRAQKRYGLALRSVSKKWPQGVEIDNDANYLSVLFLSFFEVLASYDSSSRRAWRMHLGGLGSLFSQSRKQFLSTEFGARMYRQTRSQIILHALQSRTPVLGAFANPTQRDRLFAPLAFKHFDDADMLLIRLANLQADCSVSAPSSSLISDLIILERDIADWTKHVPPSCTFSAQPSNRQSGLWWDARYDVYISGFVAHLWNKVRAARIITHDLTRKMLLLCTPHDMDNIEYAPYQINHLFPSPKIQEIVTDICATIPPFYRPPCANSRNREENNKPPLGTTFWFLWALEVVGAMAEAPYELTDWIALCFERIYELTGIIKAEFVAKRLRIGHRGPVLP